MDEGVDLVGDVGAVEGALDDVVFEVVHEIVFEGDALFAEEIADVVHGFEFAFEILNVGF